MPEESPPCCPRFVNFLARNFISILGFLAITWSQTTIILLRTQTHSRNCICPRHSAFASSSVCSSCSLGSVQSNSTMAFFFMIIFIIATALFLLIRCCYFRNPKRWEDRLEHRGCRLGANVCYAVFFVGLIVVGQPVAITLTEFYVNHLKKNCTVKTCGMNPDLSILDSILLSCQIWYHTWGIGLIVVLVGVIVNFLIHKYCEKSCGIDVKEHRPKKQSLPRIEGLDDPLMTRPKRKSSSRRKGSSKSQSYQPQPVVQQQQQPQVNVNVSVNQHGSGSTTPHQYPQQQLAQYQQPVYQQQQQPVYPTVTYS